MPFLEEILTEILPLPLSQKRATPIRDNNYFVITDKFDGIYGRMIFVQ